MVLETMLSVAGLGMTLALAAALRKTINASIPGDFSSTHVCLHYVNAPMRDLMDVSKLRSCFFMTPFQPV
jgi:hypothetical protein